VSLLPVNPMRAGSDSRAANLLAGLVKTAACFFSIAAVRPLNPKNPLVAIAERWTPEHLQRALVSWDPS
jgi:hypothetical protein